jgi:hypothetical protein
MIGRLCCLWESVEWGIWKVLGIVLDEELGVLLDNEKLHSVGVKNAQSEHESKH